MRICVVSYYDLIRNDSGGAIRTYNLALSLSRQNQEVDAIIPAEQTSLQWKNSLQVLKSKGFFPKTLLELLSRFLRIDRPVALYLYDPSFMLKNLGSLLSSDIVQIDAPVPAGAFICLTLRALGKVVVVDSHDAFQALRIPVASHLRKSLEILLEKLVYKSASLVLVVSEFDKNFLAKNGVSQNKVIVVPNGVNTLAFPNSQKLRNHKQNESLTVVFVGNMEYMPNEDAARLIISKIAPVVLKRVPNVRFLLVGKKTSKLSSLRSEVTFTGVVPDVAKILADSDVAIAPLFYGSGTRLKILEYLSCGLPVVSTSIGAEGLGLSNGVNVFIADDLKVFNERIIELLEDMICRKKMGDAGRELVSNLYDWSKNGAKLASTYAVMKRKLIS